MRYKIYVIIIVFINSLLFGIYIHRRQYLDDIVWVFPIAFTSLSIAQLILDKEKEKLSQNTYNTKKKG